MQADDVRETLQTRTDNARWADLRFADGKHTGVRVLRGTTVIEVRRDGRQTLVDIATCVALEQQRK